MKALILWMLALGGWPTVTVLAEVPRLEPFFGRPGRFGASISSNGCDVAFLGPLPGRDENHLWVSRLSHSESAARRLSGEGGGDVECYFWVGPDQLVWQSRLPGGAPRFFTGGLNLPSREIKVPRSGEVSLAGVVAGDHPALVLGISAVASATPDLFRLRLDDQSPVEEIFINSAKVFLWWLDSTGLPVAGLRWSDEGVKQLVRLPDGKVVLQAEPGDDLRGLCPTADGKGMFVVSNMGSDLTRLLRVGLSDGSITELASDPTKRVDVEQFVIDPTSGVVLAAGYLDGGSRWQSLSPEFSKLLEVLAAKRPGTQLRSASCAADKSRWLLTLAAPGAGNQVWLYTPATGALEHLWDEQSGLDPSTVCPTVGLEYPARDGTRIPALFTTPHSPPPWPLVVFPHGGPNMRSLPGYDGRVQFLASRGYAVLQPNFRGSRGFGKAFMNAGDRQWGTGVMQTDVTDGVTYLLDQGLAMRRRVAILGGSYGGYAALAGMTFTPDLYAAGICLFGVSDLTRFVAEVPPVWQPYAGDLARRLGDPSKAVDRSDLAERSPLQHAAAVRAPALIYHGLLDPLIPSDHGRAMAGALRAAGKPVSYLAASDEGHGFQQPWTEEAVYRAIELFLHQHLGGNLGPAPGAPVLRRLAEIEATGARELEARQSEAE